MKLGIPLRVWIPIVLISGALVLSGCGERLPDAGATREPFDLTVSIEPSRVTVGDLVLVEVRAVHPPDTRPVFPSLRGGGAVEVRATATDRREIDEDLMETVQRLTVTSFHIGTHMLSTGIVEFVSRDEAPVLRELPVAGFEVVSLLDAEEAPDRGELHPLLAWPRRVPLWVWVLPGVAVVAVALGWLMSHWLKQRRTIVHQPPPPPAHETALNALRLLKSKGYVERDEVEPFYTELSGIVRRYLEDRFDLRAPEQTTEEFIREAAGTDALSGEQNELVGAFLEQSDLVKFARFRPGAIEMQDALDAAERLVLETKQVLEEVPA